MSSWRAILDKRIIKTKPSFVEQIIREPAVAAAAVTSRNIFRPENINQTQVFDKQQFTAVVMTADHHFTAQQWYKSVGLLDSRPPNDGRKFLTIRRSTSQLAQRRSRKSISDGGCGLGRTCSSYPVVLPISPVVLQTVKANCGVTAVHCVLLSLLFIVFPTLRGELKVNIKSLKPGLFFRPQSHVSCTGLKRKQRNGNLKGVDDWIISSLIGLKICSDVQLSSVNKVKLLCQN